MYVYRKKERDRDYPNVIFKKKLLKLKPVVAV